jgi:hypothetical protein
MENREKLMQRDVLLLVTVGLSLLNGQAFSPYFDPIYFLLRPFIAGTFISTPLAAFYVTSIFVSVVSLAVAGIPAAIYERLRGLDETTPISIAIWLGALIVISIPTGMAFFTAS